MNNLSLSLFARLYLSIVLTVIFSVVLTWAVLDRYEQQDEFNSFAMESHLFFERFALEAANEPVKVEQEIILPFPFNLDLSAKLIAVQSFNNICNSCRLIKTVNQHGYYERDDGRWLAKFILTDPKYLVVIYEKLESDYSDDLWSQDLYIESEPELIFLLLLLITFVFLAITIYWPIKSLQGQVKSLIRSHQLFGDGKMSEKADEKIQKPLDELAFSFNEMAQAIVDNVKERDIFSQAIPHEVRTPLSRIQLASGLIRKKSTDLDVLALVDDLDNYVVDINELISQIVEFSRINDHKETTLATEQYQSIVVMDFVRSRLKLLADPSDIKITLAGNEAAELTTNPIYLRLLVDNFIKNALNHRDDKVELSVLITRNQLSITVEDDGVGIPIDDRATIFIPFARLDKSRNRKTGGLGLGLPIAKAAATKMGGRIVVSQSSLGGAMFSFTTDISG